MKKLSLTFIALVSLLLLSPPGGGFTQAQHRPGEGPSQRTRASSTATFSVDGVPLELTTSFLSDPAFFASAPTSAIQVATAVEREPLFRELSITAAPFGTSPPSEAVPVSGPGQAEAYCAALGAYREEQGGGPENGPMMDLFGEDVIGSTSVVSLHVRGEDPVPVAITEWVVEAGPRLWIVRASRELEGSAALAASTEGAGSAFSGTTLRSADLAAPSTSLASLQQERAVARDVRALSSYGPDLPTPSWWDGECNTVNFERDTGVPAYPLGAEYRGMKACGPRPGPDCWPQRQVYFGVGYPQLEWQCPEISKRFLYLAYGIPPYPGNGNQVVTNYDGELLEKVWDGTPGRAPEPNDVLSYGATSTWGHTSVVVGSDVDAAGDGTITVIEQNSSPDGYNTLNVEDWSVAKGYVFAWLHYPGWSVDYYSDRSLTDRCATDDRAGVYLFESWGDGAPATGCPADRFGARFSRVIDFEDDEYVFALGYDDGARLKIDGETVIDGWGSADEHYETRYLEAGPHQVTVEYYDDAGDAALSLFWWGAGFELTRDAQDSSRWYAEHWGNPSLWWDPVLMVQEGDGALSHHWSWDAPAVNLPVDYFSSRYRRTVSLEAGRWEFVLLADDGVRFLIDDQLIVDEWQPQQDWFTPTVTLQGGDHELVVEHYEATEIAMVSLDWERASSEITPSVWLTAPLSGTLFETCPITVEAAVDDELGAVDRVEFHVFYDGAWRHLGDDQDPPYSWVWDCGAVVDQPVGFTAHVWNEAGSEFVDLGSRVSVTLDHLEEFYLPLVLRQEEISF